MSQGDASQVGPGDPAARTVSGETNEDDNNDSTSPPTSSSSGDSSASSTSSSSDSEEESDSDTSADSGSDEGSSSDSSTSSSSSSSSSGSSSSNDSSVDGNEDDIPLVASCGPVPLQYFTDVVYRKDHLSSIVPLGERAIIKEWSTQLGCWVSRQSLVLIHHHAFARGCMRSSYHMIDFQCPTKNFVAKRYRKATVPVSQYFDDVAMHSIAEYWATQFNSCQPPKRVRFVPAAVLELCFRTPPIVFAIEPHLEGEFRKHNNNNGYVAGDNRCTPQAFSHFTFHKSHGQLMIVDIQGVGDDYTDPQIMSLDGEGYGRGNLGKKGMEKFLKTHDCNGVCEHLHLPAIARGLSKVSPGKRAARRGNKSSPTNKKSASNGVQQPSTSADGMSSPPQHLPPKSDATPPAAQKRRLPHILRESLKTVRSSSDVSNGLLQSNHHDDAFVSVARPPQAEFSLAADYLMQSSIVTTGEESFLPTSCGGPNQWGTLNYVESAGMPEEPNSAVSHADDYLALIARQAQRKADNDSVLVGDD